MKLCCINYDKVFTRHEKSLIEGMEEFSNQTGIIKKSPEEIKKFRNNLNLFQEEEFRKNCRDENERQ